MTARRRHGGRARRPRGYVPRHAAWARRRSVDEHIAAALGPAPRDDLMALADAVQEPAAPGDRSELIAACDVLLWDLELGPIGEQA